MTYNAPAASALRKAAEGTKRRHCAKQPEMRSSQSGQAFLAAKPPGRNSAMKRSELRYFEQGFVQAGHCCLSSPELKPNKEIKVQVNNQMHNRIPSSPNQSTAMQTAEV